MNTVAYESVFLVEICNIFETLYFVIVCNIILTHHLLEESG